METDKRMMARTIRLSDLIRCCALVGFVSGWDTANLMAIATDP
jgi:hypothetical protein